MTGTPVINGLLDGLDVPHTLKLAADRCSHRGALFQTYGSEIEPRRPRPARAVVTLRTRRQSLCTASPSSAHLLDNEHGLASVVAELREQERAVRRGRAVVVLLHALKQGCELRACHFLRMRSVGMQNAQLTTFEQAVQRRTGRFKSSSPNAPFHAALIDPPTVADRQRPTLATAFSDGAARARRTDEILKRFTVLSLAAHSCILPVPDD